MGYPGLLRSPRKGLGGSVQNVRLPSLLWCQGGSPHQIQGRASLATKLATICYAPCCDVVQGQGSKGNGSPRRAPQGEASEIGSRCSYGRGVQALCSVLGLRLPLVLRRGGPQGSLTDSGPPRSLQKVGEDKDVQGQCGVGTNLKG